ncbi:MAG: hypothetical protein HY888_14470 [Deltaproteobacteria bacterium]|nr:hypothetical protein [Deltaproteobacteria bacterium]
MKARILKHAVTVTLTLCATFMFALSAFATAPTNDDIKNMVTRGKAYLFSQQTPAVYTGGVYSSGGSWDSYNKVAATGFAVAALLDTGVPRTDQHIIDGVNYLRKMLGNGTDGYNDIYETNIALIALAIYNDPADLTLITNMVSSMEAWQGNDGGWGYCLCKTSGDMSHTQFGVMGLWYGYRYLGKTFDSDTTTQAVKNKLFRYLQTSFVSSNGQFGYTPGSTSYATSTSSGLWSLGMAGLVQDTSGTQAAATPTGAAMAMGVPATLPDGITANPNYTPGAIGWFNNNYSWNSDYYFLYGMAKALTIALGENGKVGEHAWVEDLKTAVYNMRVDNDATNPTLTHWNDGRWIGGGSSMGTSLVLLSLAFADVNQPVPSRILAQDTGLDNAIKGSVVIHTTGGVLIEPIRENPNDPTSAAKPFRTSTTGAGMTQETTTYLPVGAFQFKLKPVPVGGTAEFTVNLPAGALCYRGKAGCSDADIKTSFIDKNGNLKRGLDWFKLDNGKWKGNKKIPMVFDKVAGTITVTLKDGGFGDTDGLANGEITDPAAPGYDQFGGLALVDALSSLKIAAGIDTATAQNLLDFDLAPVVAGVPAPDGKIDLFDVLVILRQAVGLSVTPTGGV